jgi:hypothetical protein
VLPLIELELQLRHLLLQRANLNVLCNNQLLLLFTTTLQQQHTFTLLPQKSRLYP